MPNYKVVLFHDISDIPQQQYMKEQMNAIKNSFPDLTVELANSADLRLAQFSAIPQRMPAIMIFKNDARMQTKHAKLQHPEAINWIRSRIQQQEYDILLVNYCGDSFLRYDTPESWCTILAKKLDAKIIGFGKSGSAFEHAINSFDSIADLTIFCWTEYDRLYNPDKVINFARAQDNRKSSLFYQAAFLYYKFIHHSPTAKDSQIRQLYWFDKTVLSKYKGKCIHLWSFEETYKFEHGKTFQTPLVDLRCDEKYEIANHMTVEQNKEFAKTMYHFLSQ